MTATDNSPLQTDVELGQTLTSQAYDAVLAVLAGESHIDLATLVLPLHPADIADLVERLPLEHRAQVLAVLEPPTLGAVLVELEEPALAAALKQVQGETLQAVLSALESDDVAALVRHFSPEQMAIAKKSIDRKQRRLLEYDPETAGGMMQLEILTALPNQTVGDVLKHLQQDDVGIPPNPGSVYVINVRRKLLGSVSLHRMIRNKPKTKLEDIMRTDLLSVTFDEKQPEIIDLFEKYDIHNCAVVNKRGQLLGRITIDDVLDIIMEQAERQTFRAAGVDEQVDLFAPAMETAMKRLPWLVINLLSAILASFVIAQFEGEISQLVALAVLMPIVASMGGNAGTQALTVTVRGLAVGHITAKNALILLWKELRVGGFSGIILAVLLALGTLLIYGNSALAIIIMVATVVNHLLAAVAGYFIPILLKRFNYDPAISSGVLVTTVTDVGGFFVFLGLAALFLV